MKENNFLRFIHAFEIIVLLLVVVSIYSSTQYLIINFSKFEKQSVTDTTDWVVENKIEKPVVGFINGINPDAKVEIEKFEIPKEPSTYYFYPDSKKTVDYLSTTVQLFRKKIILGTESNQFSLSNYVISVKLDIQSLIRESKVSFTCDQIYFTDEDGKTVISHWIEYGCGRTLTIFWIRIPKINPKSKKTIYMYYGNDKKYTYSNFKTTFVPEKDMIGWYYFLLPHQNKIPDYSGSGNNGTLSQISYEDNWNFRDVWENMKPYIFFSDWQSWEYHTEKNVFFSVPSQSVQSFAHKGSIEFRSRSFYLSEQIIQRFFVDSNQQIEVGFSYDGRPFFQNGKSNNRIFFNTILEQGEWYHLIFAWDFNRKSVLLFVNGKQVNQVPQKIPFDWKQTKPLGDLNFGGFHTTDEDYGFAGFLDCLRIYNKQLMQKDALKFYQINKEELRYPKFTTSNEEKISSHPEKKLEIDFANVSKYPKTEKLQINLLYASPYNLYYDYEVNDYLEKVDSKREPPMIIDRSSKYYQPLFGFQSHFYSYIGTQIKVQDKMLVTYVGLKINDMSLIKDLSIDFSWLFNYGKEGFFHEIAFIDYFFPKAYACGPFYSYKNVGGSSLELFSISNGVIWYKLQKPIFIDQKVDVMQISYKPSTKVGVLQIQLTDMICKDQNNRLFRPVFYQQDNDKIPEKRTGPDKIIFPSQYRATFLPIEKGFVDFQRNKESGLDLVIANLGYDKISLSYDVFKYWQENLFSSIQIFNNNKLQIMNITVEDIKNHIMNQELENSYLLHFPVIDSQYIPKNNTYYITFTKPKPVIEKKETEPTKLISWILGKDPYLYHTTKYNDQSLLLYELRIAKDGAFEFVVPKQD